MRSSNRGRPEGHNYPTHLHRSKESLRSGTEGGDLEMHEEATRIVGPIDLEVARQKVRSAEHESSSFKVDVRLHRSSALSP